MTKLKRHASAHPGLDQQSITAVHDVISTGIKNFPQINELMDKSFVYKLWHSHDGLNKRSLRILKI